MTVKLPPRLLTEAEAAEVLGMTAEALRKARGRANGSAPVHTRLGTRIRYSPAAIAAFIREGVGK